MLQPNRLHPPQGADTSRAAPAAALAAARRRQVFVSADDFDTTGILTGCDPCASNYWWMPDLHGAEAADLTVTSTPDSNHPVHATRRASSRPQAAA